MGDYENQYGGYVDPSDPDNLNVNAMMDMFYQTSYPQASVYWTQGAIDKQFKAGDQRLYNLFHNNDNQNLRNFNFNLTRKHSNMICGYQRRNRKSTIGVPRFDNDELADDISTALKWTETRNGFQEMHSMAFENAVDVGQALMHMYLDYTKDPVDGDLFCDYVAYNNYLIDPWWRKQDLTDCNFIWRRRWVSKQQAYRLLPGREKEIDRLKFSGMKDGRFSMQAELINAPLNNKMTFDECHYLSTRTADMLFDPYIGEMTEYIPEPGERTDMLDIILQEQPWLEKKKVEVPTVKLVLKLGNKIFYHGENLLKVDRYPFVPYVCYYDPDIKNYAWRCQGVIRNLRDAQFLYNRRKVIELEMLESQINSGIVFPVDVVTDQKALRQKGQGKLIPLKAGRTVDEIKFIDPPVIPQSVMELSRSLKEDMPEITGLNEELLASATDDKSGILAMLRQGAGLTTLQTIFDKADYSQRLFGQLTIEAIQKNYSKNKVMKILGKEPNPSFYSTAVTKFELAVEEGNYTTTQRQHELQQLLYFQQLGMPIPMKTIMRKAFISDREQVMADMEEEQQAQAQAQQAEQEREDKKANADVMLKYAKSSAEMAKRDETVAKISELMASAEHKMTESDLNLVEKMIKLEDMEFEQFLRSVELAKQLKIEATQGA